MQLSLFFEGFGLFTVPTLWYEEIPVICIIKIRNCIHACNAKVADSREKWLYKLTVPVLQRVLTRVCWSKVKSLLFPGGGGVGGVETVCTKTQ